MIKMKKEYRLPELEIFEVIQRYCDTDLNVSSGDLGNDMGGGHEDLIQ